MKKYLIWFLFVVGFVYGQNNNKFEIFSKNEFGLYGGINFEKFSGIGNIFIFEGKTYLTSKISLKLSFGYSKIFDMNSYNIKSYDYSKINDVERYTSVSYSISETDYQVLPFSFGLQYYFDMENFNPYILGEMMYGWIDSKPIKTNFQSINYYNRFNELPVEYQSLNKLPLSTLGYAIGVGLKYKINSFYGIDIRYLFNINNEIINTHQLIVGIFL